eukprot:TRINITY_DN8364_c0_g1_i4.p1 TRINITY_DN8364_c0_g1~~TRINITY_DN8364_c0_g1_i4.p1  ORF type:complete len:464 (-),score=69.66 TRINITY_DN8364_c0_g1_i4:292-1659(-)
MGNKLQTVKIPNKNASIFWDGFLKRFFELHSGSVDLKNKKVDRNAKISLQSVARKLSTLAPESRTFPFEVIHFEEGKENQGNPSFLFVILSSEDDKIGIFLNSLTAGLQLSPELNSFVLQYCSIQNLEQIQFISHRILPRIGSTLQTLDLSGNHIIGSNLKCVSGLVESLIQNCATNLTHLYLNDVKLNDEGADLISNFAATASRLGILQLNKNEIGESGFMSLLETAKSNARITDLQVKLNFNISRKSLPLLKDVLTRNSCIADIINDAIYGKVMKTGTSARTRQFSIKMRNFNSSMRLRTNSDADAKQVPVYKWFAEEKTAERLSKRESNRFDIPLVVNNRPRRVLFGAAESVGKRPTMEDVTFLQPDFRRENEDLFIVFDGHGGKDCSEYAAKHLPVRIKENLQKHSEVSKAITESFLDVNKNMLGWATPSIQNHRITMSYFRTCSTCRSRS